MMTRTRQLVTRDYVTWTRVISFCWALKAYSWTKYCFYFNFLALTVSNSFFFTPALLRTHSFVFFAVHETRRIFLCTRAPRGNRSAVQFSWRAVNRPVRRGARCAVGVRMKQGMRVGRRASMPRAGSCTFYFTDLPADGPGCVPSGCGTFTPAPDVFYPAHLPQGGSTVAE